MTSVLSLLSHCHLKGTGVLLEIGNPGVSQEVEDPGAFYHIRKQKGLQRPQGAQQQDTSTSRQGKAPPDERERKPLPAQHSVSPGFSGLGEQPMLRRLSGVEEIKAVSGEATAWPHLSWKSLA